MHLQGTEKGFEITFSKGSILKMKLWGWGGEIFILFPPGKFLKFKTCICSYSSILFFLTKNVISPEFRIKHMFYNLGC